jgi:putative membrane protein
MGFGGGSMMGGMGGGMMGGMMGIGGMLSMLLFWIVFILLIVWIVRTVVNAGGRQDAKSILDQRYARGDITRREYEQMKKDIG